MSGSAKPDDIVVRVLGDYGPFSREGKSIGYSLQMGGQVFLLDCGAPLFQQIGGHGLKEIRGILLTHCHDDHKRWFTDLALFKMYAPDVSDKVRLLTSETVFDELKHSSGPALDRSLSADSARVVDIPFSAYVDFELLGPRARWKIGTNTSPGGEQIVRVVDRQGVPADPATAKVVIHPETLRPRILFRDPDYGEWIEPESFYPFSSLTFYEPATDLLVGDGIRIRAIKAPVWHGVPSIGIRISTETSSLVFSADTVNDPALWERLWKEKRPQNLPMPLEEFRKASVIYGDINAFIERTWSRERYQAALQAFDNAVVIHDVSTRYSAVHTDYGKLPFTRLDPRRTILTHSPDKMASEWCLGSGGKVFLVRGTDFFELVGGDLFPLCADLYYKEKGRHFVGFRDSHGDAAVYDKDGVLEVRESRGDYGPAAGRFRYRVSLYEDLGGRYYPKLKDGEGAYRIRPDGRVECVRWTETGSEGRIVEDLRTHIVESRESPESRTSVAEF